MAEERTVLYVSPLVAVITAVVVVGTLVVLAAIDPAVAIVSVIFAFVFGTELLEYVTTTVESGSVPGLVRPSDDAPVEAGANAEADATDDALAVLRRRYANGDLSDAAFERRLETLVRTETPADVERYVADGRAGAGRGYYAEGRTDAGRGRQAADGHTDVGRERAAGDRDRTAPEPDRERR